MLRSSTSKQAVSKSLAAGFLLVLGLAYSFTMNMESVHSSETLMNICQTTRCYNPEDHTLLKVLPKISTNRIH
jgi:hypothetical protein